MSIMANKLKDNLLQSLLFGSTVKDPVVGHGHKKLRIFCQYSGENKSERDLEKKRLEYEFNEQDQILNKLVEGKCL